MKKYTITFFILITLSLIVNLVIINDDNNIIDDLNMNIQVDGLQMLTTIEMNEMLEENYYKENGWGSVMYHHNNEEFSIIYSGYPDVQDSYKLTEIVINNINHSIFTINVGTESEKLSNIMESYGYNKSTHGPNFHGSSQKNYYFTKENIGVTFYIDNSKKVERILLRLTSTNVDNVDF